MSASGWLPYQGREFSAEMQTDSHDTQVFCRARERWVRFAPEETVRQHLLAFLMSGSVASSDWLSSVVIRAEYASMDVVVLGKNVEARLEPETTLLIVETKRADIWELCSPEHERQLTGYMIRARCTHGVLFNSVSGAEYSGTPIQQQSVMNDLIDLEQLLQRLVRGFRARQAEDVALFRRAKAGDFQALQSLATRFSTRGTTFQFRHRIDGVLANVAAFLVRVDGDHLTYRIRGVQTKHPQVLRRTDFESLTGIKSWD